MKAEIRRHPASFGVEVYLYGNPDPTSGGCVIYNLDGSVKQTLKFGEAAEPSFVCDSNTITALIEAGSDFLPLSQATDRHLADAVKVRDRLLDAYLPQRSPS
jgi:hypothetical protein